jgi:hypothetical protein
METTTTTNGGETMTSREKATFKNQARRVYRLGESREFLEGDEKAEAKMDELEVVLEEMEEKMSDSDREELEDWVLANGLYGILGIC